jgi:transposase
MISIGIDISKEKSTVCILASTGQVIKSPYEMNHTQGGLESLVKMIKTFDEEVRVIMEATGHYHLPVLNYLTSQDVFTAVINPLMMKKYASISIRKGKTDKIDSRKIAFFGLEHWRSLERYEIKAETYEELRLLSRQYNHYVKVKVQSKVALSNLIDLTMPGINKLLKNSTSSSNKDKLNAFIKQYWHYDNITRKSEEQFTESYLKWAKREGYQPNKSKAQKIYALAKEGIPTLKSNTASTKMLVLEAVRVLREVEKTINAILARMQELAKGLKEFEVVREMGDVTRFYSAKSLIAFAGIDTPPYQSGEFIGTRCKISKRGSKYLRKAGYEVMKSLKCKRPSTDIKVYEFIIKKENEGKSKTLAKIAGLNKFLRIYYARVKEVYALL